MTYTVRTAVFEGPLDLLLQLCNRHQIDVTAVRLSDLVAEYLFHLEQMRRLDLEVTSEFVLVAATLIELKARRLLPGPDDVDLDDELALLEERDRLLSRLLACVTFKDVAAVLGSRLEEGSRWHPRIPAPGDLPPPSALDVTVPVNAPGLAVIASSVLATADEELSIDHLDLGLPSVADAIDDLRARLAPIAESGFDDLVAHCTRPVEVIAYFLAMLELARWGIVAIEQPDWLTEIRLRSVGAES
jgi:segregation and condensation protein A